VSIITLAHSLGNADTSQQTPRAARTSITSDSDIASSLKHRCTWPWAAHWQCRRGSERKQSKAVQWVGSGSAAAIGSSKYWQCYCTATGTGRQCQCSGMQWQRTGRLPLPVAVKALAPVARRQEEERKEKRETEIKALPVLSTVLSSSVVRKATRRTRQENHWHDSDLRLGPAASLSGEHSISDFQSVRTIFTSNFGASSSSAASRALPRLRVEFKDSNIRVTASD
jgi:hypothetical protein